MSANQDSALWEYTARVMDQDNNAVLGTATPYAADIDAMVVIRSPIESEEDTTDNESPDTTTPQQRCYEGARSPYPSSPNATPSPPLLTTPSPTSPSHPETLPTPSHQTSESHQTWLHARATLADPQYYYTTTFSARPYKHLLNTSDDDEIFSLRNHNLILATEQLLSEFRVQLRGCLVWRDEEMLTEVWKRLLEAREGMVMLEQPGRGRVRGH